MKLGPVVQEEMSFKEKVTVGRTDGRTKTNHNSSHCALGSGELKSICCKCKNTFMNAQAAFLCFNNVKHSSANCACVIGYFAHF